MVPPPRGGNADIPLNAAGTKIADSWPGPAPDEAAKAECKYYGAASLMFQPTRLRVTWQDDQTLRVDTDAGTQTRLFRFTTPRRRARQRPRQRRDLGPTRKFDRVVESRRPAAARAGGGGGRGAARTPRRISEVTTTNMFPGYPAQERCPYGKRSGQ
jgi:hypothetical protein